MSTERTEMNITAFAHNASPFLRRLKRPLSTASTKWLCSASGPGSPAGRGVWDLHETPSRSYSGRPNRNNQPSHGDDDYTRPTRRGQPGRYSDSGRDFSDPRRDSRRTTADQSPRRGSRGRSQQRFQRHDPDDYDLEPYDYGTQPRYRDDRNGQWSGRRDERGAWRPDPATEEPSLVQQALAAEEDDLVYGVTPVLLALLSGRRGRFEALYVQEGRGAGGAGPARKADNDAAFEKVLTVATGKGLAVHRVPKGDLNALSRNRPHQGLVLQAAPLEYEELSGLPRVEEGTVNGEGRAPCWLVLDEVADPQNAGALLRSAYFLGADGVIACRRNSARLSPVVSKASAGALEVMRVRGVASMPRFLRRAREDGWRVVGTALGGGAVSVRSLVLDRPTLVVMGSEGHGLRAMVREACDVLVRIGGAPVGVGVAEELGLKADPVDSLNVSVAGAVALYQLLGR